MAYLLGVVRGLDACSSPSGTFTVLALDHRQNLRKELRPADPTSVTEAEMVAFKRAVVRALGRAGTGILLDPETGHLRFAHDLGGCQGNRTLPAAGGLPGCAECIAAQCDCRR